MSGLDGNAGVLNMYTGKQTLNSSLLIKPYTAWHGLFSQGLTNSNAATLTYTSGVAEFAAGKAAMTITGEYYDTQISKGLPARPTSDSSPCRLSLAPSIPKSLLGGPNNAYVLFKNAKNVADCIKLLKFLTTVKVQLLGINELGQAPNNTSFKVTPSFAASQPLLAELNTYIKNDHYALDEAFDGNVHAGQHRLVLVPDQQRSL